MIYAIYEKDAGQQGMDIDIARRHERIFTEHEKMVCTIYQMAPLANWLAHFYFFMSYYLNLFNILALVKHLLYILPENHAFALF